MKFSTKAIHAGIEPDKTTGAIMTPAFFTSTYIQDELGKHRGYEYSRVSNPTRTVLENNLAALENGKEAMAFASGMAAIDAVMHLLKPGDHVILSNNMYGGTYRIGKLIYEDFKLNFSFVDTTEIKNIHAALHANTKMIFVESLSNPNLQVTDIKKIAQFSKKHKLISVVDNTFVSPYLQTPLDFGIDIVLHSLTKYLNGHSDMLGGVAITKNKNIIERLRFFQKAIGGILSPMDAWLCLRGVKTLAVRMEQHCKNAKIISEWLTKQSKIKKVNYPGLKFHPQHNLAKEQLRNFGGMISFDLGNLNNAKLFLKNVKLCSLAESLGGVESLISHPASMTHASFPKKVREQNGVTDGLVRLSVGIEDVNDIIKDLEFALTKI